MTERLLLVSTCGTSLFTNNKPKTGDQARDWVEPDREWLKKVANEVEVDSERLKPLVENRREWLKAADAPTRHEMSAELNGIGAVLERYKPKQLFHLLVHTDTALGETAAELVQEVLGDATSLVSAGGLRTNNLASFREALADLTKQLDALVQSYREQGWFVVFNLTGGFKSLNGYLQTLAMISADRCVFLFEGAAELMEIPRLPVRLSEADDLSDYLETFRRLAVGYSVQEETARGAPEALLMEDAGEVTTSVLGDVAWARHRSALFAEKLLSPLSNKVRVTDAVRKVFTGLEAVQKVQVNEALDEFCAYVDKVRLSLKSRTFKKLQGDPVPGSTHELYAWSDGSAGRLFGHYDTDGCFVFDKLDNHL